jgi:hypothetical protein
VPASITSLEPLVQAYHSYIKELVGLKEEDPSVYTLTHGEKPNLLLAKIKPI